MTASSARRSRRRVAVALVAAGAWHIAITAQTPLLKLRAVSPGAAGASSVSIELSRWSTDAERPSFVAALSAPVAAPVATVPAAPPGRGAARGGRGGRGGREAGPPPSPIARLNAAVKAAPTLGYIWGDGPTGYAIKYAWHATDNGGRERIVLATDRVLGAHLLAGSDRAGGPADAEFTVVELRLDAAGRGEGKTSLAAPVVVDKAAATLALDAYASAPVQLRITR